MDRSFGTHSNAQCTATKTYPILKKMNYMRSKLTGEAKSAISGIALSNENYAVAISLLPERFGKAQEVIDLHYFPIST